MGRRRAWRSTFSCHVWRISGQLWRQGEKKTYRQIKIGVNGPLSNGWGFRRTRRYNPHGHDDDDHRDGRDDDHDHSGDSERGATAHVGLKRAQKRSCARVRCGCRTLSSQWSNGVDCLLSFPSRQPSRMFGIVCEPPRHSRATPLLHRTAGTIRPWVPSSSFSSAWFATVFPLPLGKD